jgi:long-chain acyl-CoA synthetase
MSHPSHHARTQPDKIAYRMARSGDAISYRELDARSNQGAHVFRSLGLRAGDHIALVMENRLEFLAICWAAQRSGLYFTPISCYLTRDEVAYIVADCGARVVITSRKHGEVLDGLDRDAPGAPALYTVDEPRPGFRSWSQALAAQPDTPIADEVAGQDMLYSSGTTGRPKGIKRPLDNLPIDQPHPRLRVLCVEFCGMSPDTVYLSPAPLYHAAPLGWSMAVMAMGGTVVMMERFDAEDALRFIEQYRVTTAQWVPTHFVRMLKLPSEVRARYDMSSLTGVFHAAAPCPVPVKEQMIAWWGPIVHEYYAGTEGNGFVYCNSEMWLAHPGTVGTPIGCVVHICGEDLAELPHYESGTIYFEGGAAFEYHNDPEKTRASRHPHGWSTLGDVGYLDDDNYLYLTDRKAYMIISGGVNIYPQEAENVLVTHPKVVDVAVFGVPNDDFGEEVKAVVQPVTMPATQEEADALTRELIAYSREQLADVKCPRTIDYREELPRHPTGKLYKRLLKDEYWKDAGRSI